MAHINFSIQQEILKCISYCADIPRYESFAFGTIIWFLSNQLIVILWLNIVTTKQFPMNIKLIAWYFGSTHVSYLLSPMKPPHVIFCRSTLCSNHFIGIYTSVSILTITNNSIRTLDLSKMCPLYLSFTIIILFFIMLSSFMAGRLLIISSRDRIFVSM